MSDERAIETILSVAHATPEALALEVAGETWSYGELLSAAAALASRLPMSEPGSQPRVAIMAQREASAYIGILAAHLNGCAYVPVNVAHPAARSACVLEVSGATHVVAGDLSTDKLSSVLSVEGAPAGLKVVETGDRKADYPTDKVAQVRGEPTPHDLAYILFTSGSSGTPKGVPIGHRQLQAYLSAAKSLLPDISASDRFSQCFDLTFDLSVHDVFLSLTTGATLVVPSTSELEDPARYIKDKTITAWFSVPSLAFQMRLQQSLAVGAFPGLKHSLFCGEALPATLAEEWRLATPNGTVANWYGPTEATIACAHFPVTGPLDQTDVPLGQPFPGMALHVLDDALRPTTQGELYLSGPQLAEGYLDAPEKTAKAFLILPDGTPAYRTGDLARRDAGGVVHFLGRADNQVKLRGFRIELGEVEAVLRDASDGANAVALPWPPDETPRALVAAVEGEIDHASVQTAVTKRLPDYMQPTEFVSFDRFPRNSSGKADRAAIASAVRERLSSGADLAPISPEKRRVLDAVRRAAPAVSAKSVLQAPSLLDAGMDSLSFVEFTMLLQQEFGHTLDEAGVVRLSEMPFDAIAREVSSPARTAGGVWKALRERVTKSVKRNRKSAKRRANRAIQFIDRFPDVVRDDGAPLVLAVGSSGTFRGIDPKVIERSVAERGVTLRVMNVGLPAVTVDGITQICRFIKEQCKAASKDLPLVLYEFDPMHCSISPPSGDISLGPEFFSGKMKVQSSVSAAREFEWNPAAGGAWQPETLDTAQERRPEWARKREHLVAQAYLGGLAFDPARLVHWQGGARELQGVTEHVVGFIHPADKAMLDQVTDRPNDNALANVQRDLRNRLGLSFVPWDGFDLAPEDFMNINHANPKGRARLSEQLARYLLESGDLARVMSRLP
ncbi:MAG: non-ribosomal peptide synthetase [Pseudomonadota bacterium]